MVATLQDVPAVKIPVLRISTTGECNLNCFYCHAMGHNKDLLASKAQIIPSDVTKIVKISAEMGVRKVLIAGGEPLLRKDAANFVKSAFGHRNIEDVRLVTNGTFLKAFADQLRKLGLRKVDVNFDSLNFMKYQRITGSDSLYRVLDGIEKVERLNFHEIRLNIFMLEGINQDEIIHFARMTRERKLHIRLLEYSPNAVNSKDPNRNKGQMPVDHVRKLIDSYESLHEVPSGPDEPYSVSYQFKNAAGKISFLSKELQATEHAYPKVLFDAQGFLSNEQMNAKPVQILSDLRRDAKDPKLHKIIEKILNIPEGAVVKSKSRGRSASSAVSRVRRPLIDPAFLQARR